MPMRFHDARLFPAAGIRSPQLLAAGTATRSSLMHAPREARNAAGATREA